MRNDYLARRDAGWMGPVYEFLGCGNLHDEENLALITQLHQALHAEVLLARDIDYVVKDGKVKIVQTFGTANIGREGIDMEPEGLKGPSSTWTYLVTDNPFGTWFQRLYRTVTHPGDMARGLKHALANSSS